MLENQAKLVDEYIHSYLFDIQRVISMEDYLTYHTFHLTLKLGHILVQLFN